MPNRLPAPNTALYVSSRIGTGAVPVIHMATPVVMPSVPSVTRNDGMPARVTSRPLIEPTINPVSKPAKMPAATPNLEIVSAVATAPRPATAPTDRSISALEITKVMATAITEIVAVCRTMFKRLLPERKPYCPRPMAKATKITTKPMYTT